MDPRGRIIARKITAQADNSQSAAELLANFNATAHTARTLWIFFLTLMAYLLVSLASVTHIDLLLNKPLRLPILQVDIGLKGFFSAAPAILIIIHFGLLIQFAMLARKADTFNSLLGSRLKGDMRDHPLRMQVTSYFYAQQLAGPDHGPVMRIVLSFMTIGTVYLFPVLLLLFFQARYLPAHESEITWAHRAYLLSDCAILVAAATLRSSGWLAFRRAARRAAFLTAFVMYPALAVLLIPDERLEQYLLRNVRIACWPVSVTVRERNIGRSACLLTALLFEGSSSLVPASTQLKLSRSLVINNEDLVLDQPLEPPEPSLRLRGRNLRYANFNNSDLHRADFSGADLSFASLEGSNLRRSKFDNASLEGADFTSANLQFTVFRQAMLAGADFSYAEMTNAILGGARGYGAKFRGANLIGAYMSADFPGADFVYAELWGADFSSFMEETSLDGAYARNATIQGVSLIGVNLTAVDLTGAKIWQSEIEGARVEHIDLSMTSFKAAASGENALPGVIAALEKESDNLFAERKKMLSSLIDEKSVHAWSDSEDLARWTSMRRASRQVDVKVRSREVASYLVDYVCKADGERLWAARGIIARASEVDDLGQGQRVPLFNGDLVYFHQGLLNKECRSVELFAATAPEVMEDLRNATSLLPVVIW